jgi:SAM-dependent methyltransferase
MLHSEPFRIDDSRMPLLLGSALKVPSYAYKNWGIPEGKYRQESEDLYACEWEGGSSKQMEYVIEAITRTGLGNFSQLLRDRNADVVSDLINESSEKINYLEPGAGVSTINLYEKMEKRGVDAEKVFSTLIEPSADRLEKSAESLKKMGLKEGRHFKAYPGKKDTDALVIAGPETQDIIGTVAQIHHHSYLDSPLAILAATLKPNGYLISSDWHNSLWEHPNRVYEYLKECFDWETKDRDLATFAEMYPKALESAQTVTGADFKANEMIKEFWKSWSEIRTEAIKRGEFSPEDDIFMLEAHKPVERYIETGYKVGLKSESRDIDKIAASCVIAENPHRLLDDSSILYTTLLQK